jgi:hypothetical protein
MWQVTLHEGQGIPRPNDEGNARILTADPLDEGWDKSCRSGFRTADPQLTCCGISEELDLSNTLPQFVENGRFPPQKRLSVDCWLDALGGAIEKLDA